MMSVPRTPAELALERALDYLAGEIAIDDDAVLAVLALVEEGVGARVNPLLPWVMERLPARFGLQHEAPPAASPRMRRASIGYDR